VYLVFRTVQCQQLGKLKQTTCSYAHHLQFEAQPWKTHTQYSLEQLRIEIFGYHHTDLWAGLRKYRLEGLNVRSDQVILQIEDPE